MANNIIWIAPKNTLGRSSSMQPISFENRFKMLVFEFVSKKAIGAWSTETIIFWWRRSEERRVVAKKNDARMIDSMKTPPTIAA